MFNSFSRSYLLVRHSWAVLKKDKEIMIFPVLSGVASLAVAASFIIPLVVFGLATAPDQASANASGDKEVHIEAAWYAYTFAFYLASYFITIFFNVGVMHCASIRMNGGDPTVADGFKGAFSRIGSIFVWSLVSATVGMILRLIEERAGLIGKIISAIVGVAWSLLTYFAVPVMIFEGAGLGKSIKRSAELFKKTWGETVVAEAGMGLFFGALTMLGVIPIVAAVYLGTHGIVGALAAVIVGATGIFYWIALAVVSTALKGIFHVALYRYASTGLVPKEYPEELVARHWRPKT